jgi:hypothetical protein
MERRVADHTGAGLGGAVPQRALRRQTILLRTSEGSRTQYLLTTNALQDKMPITSYH